jgi:Arc/MetJ-type ribon-helix-helix transcriptional regulator
MKRKAKAVKLIKTSISLPEGLYKFAEDQCAQQEFSSFSAYLQALIRADKEACEKRSEQKGGNPQPFPPAKTQRLELNEPKP